MKKFLTAIPTALLVIASTASAFEYQGDVTGGLLKQSGKGYDVRVLHIVGRYHFAPIETDDRPLAEADFFARTSFVSLGLDDYGDDMDENGMVFGGQYVEPESNFLFGAEVSTGDLDGFEFRGGLYLDQYVDHDATLIFSFSTEDDTDKDTFTATYKTVQPYQDHLLSVEAEISIENSDPGSTTTVGGSAFYYLDRMTGIGPIFNLAVGENDGYDLGIQGTHALNEQFGVGGSFALFTAGEDDGVRFQVFAQGRF